MFSSSVRSLHLQSEILSFKFAKFSLARFREECTLHISPYTSSLFGGQRQSGDFEFSLHRRALSAGAGAVNPGNQGLLVGERRLADSLALEHRVKQRRVFLSCFCSLNDI